MKPVHMKMLFYCLLAVGLLAVPKTAHAQCIDFYDLEASYVKCEVGPYSARTNPSQWRTKRVDYGPREGMSRHTINRSASAIDTITTLNNTVAGLHTVPSGEVASVRLGNWWDAYDACFAANDCPNRNSWTGEAERITYTFTVTEESKYLLMRYAIVWENPNGHNDVLPSFQIETLLGATGETSVDATDLCYNYDMTVGIATVDYQGNATIRHHVCNGSTSNHWTTETHPVAWCNWRTRVLNLEPFVGQTIRLRITSSDCGHKGHFGYSYYTLRCLDVNLYSPTCGGPTETRTFTAPEGLNYIWYRVNDAKERVELLPETSNSLTVLNDGQTYECYIASPENANCHISLYAKAEPFLPKSAFTIDKHESCVDTLFLIDESGVSRDGVIPNFPHEDVDAVIWDLGDGRSNVLYTPGTPIVYDADGTYQITQITRLNNGNCTDTLVKTVTVRGKETEHKCQVYDTICGGEVYHWNGGTYTRTGVYPYVIEHGAANGFCDSTVILNLQVWDSYHWSDTINVLEGKEIPYVWHRDGQVKNLYTTGVYYDSCYSTHGCDSIYKLVMTVRPRWFFLEQDTICKGESKVFHKNGVSVTYTESGTYYDSLLTKTYGNDSIYCLQLYVRPGFAYTETRKFCKGDTVNFKGERFWTDGPHTIHFTDMYGCDSTYTIILQQQPTYLIDTIVNISAKEKPFIWNGENLYNSGSYLDSLKTTEGCDSIVRLKLNIYPVFFQEDFPLTICKDSTVRWHTKYITGTTVGTFIMYDSLKNIYGYDSVYKVTYTVLPSYRKNITEERAIGETYYFFGTPITTGGTYTFDGTTERGCDSIIKLTISFYPKYYIRDTASFCQGGSYTYHKNGSPIVYTSAGTYYDSLKTVHGYDSIFCLTLSVKPKYFYSEQFTICEGDEYLWHNQLLRTAGIYHDSAITVGGCDSVYRLTLNVDPSPVIHVYDDICEGNYVMFGGKARYTGGTYYDSLSCMNTGCDSVRVLHLTVRPVPRVNIDEHLCDGDFYNYKGRMLTHDTVFADTVMGVNGCDSITSYTIYFHPVVRDTVRAAICQGENYIFYSHVYSTGGMYILNSQSAYHCDSTHVLILTVNPKYNKDTTLTLCHGDAVSVFGKLYTSGGTYYDTLKTVNGCGCDSAYTIYINEYTKYFDASSASFCNGDTLFWHGDTITAPGIYYDSLQSKVSGCDSVYQLTVNTKYPKYREVNATILDIEYYDFNGKSINTAGVYRDTLFASSNGCDSVVQLTLTVLPTYNVTEYSSICDGQIYLWNGLQLDSTGTYTVTLKSKYNTDSVVTLGLTVYKSVVRLLNTVHISNQEYYVWDGDTIRQTGTYDHHSTSKVTHCDSITRLNVVVHPTYHYYDSYVMCSNEFYSWHGNTYNTTGDYVFNPKTLNWGYDSIYELHLTVLPTYFRQDTAEICEGDFYNFLGNPLSEGGHYVDTIQATNGCDSIVHLLLIKHPVNEVTETHSICKGDVYSWHGLTLSANGVYHDTLRSVVTHCDSLRYTLTLIVQDPFYQEKEDRICANEYYSWHGKSYNQTGVYYDSLIAHMPPFCDSIYCLKLTVNPTYEQTFYDTICEGQSVLFGSQTYTQSGFYTQHYPAAGTGCDSTVHFHLTVIPKDRIQRTVHLCDGDYFHFHGENLTTSGMYIDTTASVLTGCDSITTYNVHFHPIVHDSVHREICEGEGFSFYGQTFYTAGTHIISGQSAYGCDSTHILNLTVHPAYKTDTSFTLCTGDYVQFNGKVYYHGGYYEDTAYTVHGCDSIYRIRINEYMYTDEHLSATICNGDSVEWRGRWLKSAGTYKDTVFHNESGCHDYYEMVVKVKNTFLTQLEATITSIDYYSFNGRLLRKDSVYYDTLQSVLTGCDSVVQLTLHVTPKYVVGDQKTICEGETYYFNNMALDSTGVYTTNFHHGDTDSIVTLTLTVYKPIIHEKIVHMSDKETYLWYDSILTRSGTYDSITPSKVTGCDSIERLKLYVHPTYLYEEYWEMCSDQRYTWHKYSGLNKSGVYYDSLLTDGWNYDSIHVLYLTVNPTYRHDTVVHICEGEYYEFGGQARYDGGRYSDIRYTEHGCDSTFTLTLIQHPSHHIDETKTICRGDFYIWRGDTLTEGGIYDDTLKTTDGYGCDSIFRLTLNTHYQFYQEYVVNLCEGEYYDFNGRQLNKTGIYWDSLNTTMYGCDSIYKLDLRVHPKQRVAICDTICGDEYYMFNGRPLYQGGIYKDTLLNIYDCDSIITLQLMHFPVSSTHTPRSICRGDKTPWTLEGQPIMVDRAGTYTDILTSKISGCDSIVELWLTVTDTFYREQRATICSSDYYEFQGRLYNKTGIYWDSLTTTRSGCDSIYKLDLKVNPAYLMDTTVWFCDFDSYYFGGKEITKTGTYIDSLYTFDGCDSIHILRAFVYPSRRDSIRERVCFSDYYDFNGRILTGDGIYRDTLSDPVTRQCIISIVNLTFTASTKITGIHVEDACADDDRFAIHSYYIGSRPETFSLVFDSISHVAGFVDVLDQPFEDIIYAPIPSRDGGTYIRPDYYHAHLTLDNSVCFPDSSSSTEVALLLRYPSWIIEQNWNDVVALLNEEFNGGYVFSEYEWYVNGVKSNETGPYIYMPYTLALGDEVVIAPTRQGEDYAVPSCPIIIYDKRPELVTEFPVFCEVSAKPGQFYLHAQSDGDYTVYTISGQALQSGSYHHGDKLTINVRGAAGCYMVRLNTPDYGVRVEKIVLR